MTNQQKLAIAKLCDYYDVTFDESHYGPGYGLPEGWVQGWIGGMAHANKQYVDERWHHEITGKPTIFVGCDPFGRISS